MKQKILSLLLFGLLGITTALAQEREITGKVTDNTGAGLPGAAVIIENTTTGTSTDDNGMYKIKASTGTVLVFTMVGYPEKKVTVGASNVIDITLEEGKYLDEVQVSSYRAMEREKFVGAITTINTKVMEQVPIASFDQVLQGRAAGLMVSASSGRPGAPANVRIRGVGTISSSTEPLYVLDGVPIAAQDFATLNPNDFETINVLKDASATSVYGSRGANGVILITTKKGKVGATKVTYRAQYGVSTRTTNRFGMMNTAEKIRFERLLFDQGTTYGKVGNILNSGGTPEENEAEIAKLATVNTDWTKLIFRAGQQESHELNFSGGSEKVRFYVAGNFRREEGIVILTNLDRYTLRTNLEFSATQKLKVGVNATVGTNKESQILETGNNLNNPVLYAFTGSPYNSPFNPDGSYSPNDVNDYEVNLYQAMHESKRYPNQVKLVGNIYLEYEVPRIKGLIFKTTVGIDYTRDEQNSIITPQSFNQGGLALGSGRLIRGNFREQSFINYNTLRYNRNFGDRHTLSAIIGNELIQRYYFQSQGVGFGLNPQLSFPVTTNGITGTQLTNSETRNALASYFLDIAYSLDNKYNLTVSGRRDGSSRFGLNKRFAYFYSIGAAWNMHNEAFYQNITFLSNNVSSANLRASYGTSGNQEPSSNTSDGDNFRYAPAYGASSYAGTNGIAPTFGNPDLQWEQSATFNAGLDLGILKNRIKLTVEYYNRVTSQLFIPITLSRMTGFRSATVNAGKMRNRGVEVSVDADVIKINKFTWNLAGNVTFNRNRILDLGGQQQFVSGDGTLVRVGLPVRTHYLVKWAGVNPANGEALYYDKEGNVGQYNGDALVPFGTYEPTTYGGFTNTFTYGDLSLSAFFSWAHGNQLYNINRAYSEDVAGGGGGNLSSRMLNIWTTPGQVTNIPRVDQPIQLGNTSRFLESGAFLRLRNVMLSYNITGNYLKTIKISNAKIYCQAQNLLTFTTYNGFDPEATNNGLGYSNFPVARVYTVGLDLTF